MPTFAQCPRIVWMLWLQGWEAAPAVAKAGLHSWRSRNPGWDIRPLDRSSLSQWLPSDTLERIFGVPKPPEALANQIRMELLHRHGGVWADATTLCARPLDDWLPEAMPRGFQAFDRPTKGRMVSNWFIAASRGAHILKAWRDATWDYWRDRTERDQYFWHHALFATLYETDPVFRSDWDATLKIPARHRFHFSPNDPRLLASCDETTEADLADPPAPVFKLTHKFEAPPGEGSVFERLLAYGFGA